ncbi:hypothetical protein BCR36DRAFT_579506 [Piromyces finnis]|uniref:Uncharacterized protein n=1 Tax=Piromyces finnis TaxID=1754191 RepID=A0A1Y1VMB9_9FUNG|nr:hypothetical protein BCR36DRAFT_579506 [Piromyces finnis]|eukprot:ORX60065.1 hypothetical protein BCR36DRAFT_579506 [Piromyces finnis]
MRCFKKKRDGSITSSSNDDNNNNGSKSVRCSSLVTEVSASDIEKINGINTSDGNEDTGNNSDDDNDTPSSVSFNYIDNFIVPKGTLINDNEECVTAIYNINKLIKQTTSSSIFEQSCDSEFDIDAFTKGLDSIKGELSQSMNEAISKCGNSKIWNGAKLHQACRILGKTGQTVCYSIVDDVYEKYDSKCLENATLSDMWEFSTWLWNQLINVNNGCYLKQLYNYKCNPKKDAIVHMGSNSYSLRMICESSNNNCEWPGTYTGNNESVKCLSKSIEKNKNIAINVLKKNGYVCEGSTDLPQTLPSLEDENSSDDDVPYAEDTSSEDSSNTSNSKAPIVQNFSSSDSNNLVENLNTDANKKAYIVSSGTSDTDPWTNINQIVGTIFIAVFALLF